MDNSRAIPTHTTLADVPGYVHCSIVDAVVESERAASPAEWAVNDELRKIASHWDADQRWLFGNEMAAAAIANASNYSRAREAVQRVIESVTKEWSNWKCIDHSRTITRAAIATHNDPSLRPIPGPLECS